MSFPRRTLADISESVDYGVTASASSDSGGPKFLRITDIQDGKVDWSVVPWCKASIKEMASARLKPGDIVFARTGATTGKSFLIRCCPDDAVFASYLIRLRLADHVHPPYISHFFQTPDYWQQISKNANGAAQPGVNASVLKTLEVPIPPLPEQRRIAAILDQADALRTQRRQALAELDKLPLAFFVEMFGDPIANPKGWPVKRLNEVCHCYSGGTPSKANATFWEGSVPWFSAKDMKADDLFDSQDHISETVTRDTNLKLLAPDTVVIVVRGMILAHTFPVCVLRVSGTINQDLKALIPKVPLGGQFLANCLRAQAGAVLERVSEAGHGTKRLDSEGLHQIAVILPPQEKQTDFAAQVKAIESLIITHRKALVESEALFASLQQRAFTGAL